MKESLRRTLRNDLPIGDVFGRDTVNKWLQNCVSYRHYIKNNIAAEQGRNWSAIHRRAINMIRNMRMDFRKTLPSTEPYRIDASTKYIPTENVPIALGLGHLPHKIELSLTYFEMEWLRQKVVALKPAYPWGVQRLEDDLDRRAPSTIYFSADEDIEQRVKDIWLIRETKRVKRLLAA